MHVSKNIFFGLTSLACLTFSNDLLAATSVTSSAGDTSSGTLSSAILSINGGTSASPIQIETGVTPPVSPTLTTNPFSTITTSMTIGSETTGTGVTIDGNSVAAGINITAGTTTFTSDITFDNTSISVSNGTVILTGETNNWNGVSSVTLDTGTVEFLISTPPSSLDQSFNGNITLSGGTALNTISINSSYYNSLILTINGNITESSPSAQLEFINIAEFFGPIILTGTNSWTGGTILNNIGVQINSVNSFPSTDPITLINANIVFSLSNTDSFTLQGNITGSGSVIEISGGNITLPGAITGVTDISLKNGTITLSGTCSCQNILFESGPSTLYVTGVLNGISGLSIDGPNVTPPAGTILTIILSNTNTYTGATYLTPYCTLQVTADGSFGTSADLVTMPFSSFLINSGNITASTFQNYGTVTLNSGSNITIASPGIYYNYDGGTTSGCGTITGNYETTGGTYPGCSPSPLTITGDATFVSGSLLSPYLDSTGVAALDVSGDVTLDSGVILEFRPEPGCYVNGETRDFLTVGGTLTGTFSSVDMGTLLLTPHITYGTNGATLTIQKTSLASIVQGNNAKKVGKILDILIEEGDASGDHTFCDVAGTLMLLSQEGISTVLNQLQPALFKGFAIAAESSIVRVEEALIQRLENELDEKHCLAIQTKNDPKALCTKEKKMFHAWAAGIGNALNQKSTYYAGSPQVGYHENMGGAVAGIDAFFAKCLYAGVLGAYSSTDVKWHDHQGSGNIQSGYAGTYFSAIGDMFYGNASIIGSLNSYDGKRSIFLPETTPVAKNNHGGSQLLSHFDTGVNLGWSWFTLRPFDSFDYIAQKERGFTENGADQLDLSVKKSNSILLRNELGLNLAGCFCLQGSKWVISPKISWVREVRITGSSYTAKFVNTDTSFTVTGYFPDRSLVSPGVNITGTMLQDRLTLTAYYNGEIRGNYSNHSYGGEVRFGF